MKLQKETKGLLPSLDYFLRIASQATLSPLIDFPAMLSMPPGEVPQPVPLFALIQPDEQNRAMATLLRPNEVSATIIPMN
ncbi:MAG: hypothetical protein JNL29_17750 [Nitrospira sp.]|nr:hypothetical protein [Nitrospira sp.]